MCVGRYCVVGMWLDRFSSHTKNMSGIIEICHETASINNRQNGINFRERMEKIQIFWKNVTTAQISESMEAKQYEKKECVAEVKLKKHVASFTFTLFCLRKIWN